MASFASAALIAAALATAAGTPLPTAGGDETGLVRQAVERCARTRLGEHVDLDIDVTAVRVTRAAVPLVAVADTGARLGQVSRFTLFAQGRRRIRLGEASAVVRARAALVTVRRPITLGSTIAPEDVTVARGTLDGGRFVPPPDPALVIGARASRFLLAGTVLTASDVVPEPVVKAGDEVRATVRLASGGEIRGVAVALQSGAREDVIALRNPESRRTRRGRITGPGEVEVVDEHR